MGAMHIHLCRINILTSVNDGLVALPVNSSDFILYTALLGSIVLLLILIQARTLARTRRLLREKQQAYGLIESQKAELELKEKDITDSLIYAQRIQEALLPSETYFRKHFHDSFILFKPKNIVSGDFYWIGEKNEKIFIVAADCTGHGVPGALMSMIGLEAH